MRPRQHPQNSLRLKTLASYDVLDTPPESEFDDIVALIAAFCEVPVALVSLVDEDRQWFKARTGLDLPETPVSQSVCAHAILHSDLLEIEDTRTDPRTRDNPLLHGDTPLLFYAGAPLVAPNGMPLGTLCVLDYQPRRLTAPQRHALRTLAAQVVKMLELKRLLKNEETLRAEMDHRIKNSLQATSSLVRLYNRAVEDPAARDALEAVQRRIDAMSALHQQLQNSSTGGTIHISSYLKELTDSLRNTIPTQIALTLTCDDTVNLPSRSATDIGIILSEFIANSIKHGFPDGRAGKIAIDLVLSDENKLVLQAQDNGAGTASPPPPPSQISGIGSSLVAAAASNLGGMLANELTDKGARLSLVFDPG